MKILIIGIVASGKTTLAKRLAKENAINYYEIDSIVHNDENNIKRNNHEQQEIIESINKQNDWIIEGTLRKNLDNLLELSDKIIYLDIPLKIRKRRIFFRYLKQKFNLEKCSYETSIKMLKNMYKWTREFEKNKISFERRIFSYKEKVVTLRSAKEIKNYKV